jgi:hypothetical protein
VNPELASKEMDLSNLREEKHREQSISTVGGIEID